MNKESDVMYDTLSKEELRGELADTLLQVLPRCQLTREEMVTGIEEKGGYDFLMGLGEDGLRLFKLSRYIQMAVRDEI